VEQTCELVAEERVQPLAGGPKIAPDQALDCGAILQKTGHPSGDHDAAAARSVHGSKIGRLPRRENPWRE
jgi:hypothetical protein